jgi:hypothetical protein
MQTQAPGTTAAQKGQAYNSLLSQGFNDAAIRSSADTLFGNQSGADWNALVQQGGMQAGRPLPGSAQFYQPQYQTQYNNMTTTNPLGVSQYGQPMTAQSLVDSAYAGVGRYGMGTGANQVDQSGRQYWLNQLNSGAVAPQDFFKSFNTAVRDYQTANPNDPYSTYTRQSAGYQGGFGGFGGMPPMQTPFSFGGQQMGGGYGQYGMNNPFSPYSNTFMNMPSNLNQMGQADKVGFYQGALDRGFNDQQVYNQASGLFGQQSPQDWSYLQNQAAQQRTSSGPASRIVGRSAQMRGAPGRAAAYAEGGITSLLDKE